MDSRKLLVVGQNSKSLLDTAKRDLDSILEIVKNLNEEKNSLKKQVKLLESIHKVHKEKEEAFEIQILNLKDLNISYSREINTLRSRVKELESKNESQKDAFELLDFARACRDRDCKLLEGDVKYWVEREHRFETDYYKVEEKNEQLKEQLEKKNWAGYYNPV